MTTWSSRVNQIDVQLFELIPSQTSAGDRRSLLAIQRTVARRYGQYVYLEIGSHLGGSIQPHLVDERCTRIYSIDPRPSEQPDDRAPGHVAYYENNSTERMLALLGQIGHGDMSKIITFDLDASEIDLKAITPIPHIAFIDGEHTNRAVRSDFDVCRQVTSKQGIIIFHDFGIIHPAIEQICNHLTAQNINYRGLKLEGGVSAIFLDPSLVDEDEYLREMPHLDASFWRRYKTKRWIKKQLPKSLVKQIRAWR